MGDSSLTRRISLQVTRLVDYVSILPLRVFKCTPNTWPPRPNRLGGLDPSSGFPPIRNSFFSEGSLLESLPSSLCNFYLVPPFSLAPGISVYRTFTARRVSLVYSPEASAVFAFTSCVLFEFFFSPETFPSPSLFFPFRSSRARLGMIFPPTFFIIVTGT